MSHSLTEFHSFNGNTYNASPVLLPAEHLHEHSLISMSLLYANHHEHARAYHVSFVLHTMLVDIKLGQVVNKSFIHLVTSVFRISEANLCP